MGSAQEYGFSMWLRASYLDPAFFNFERFHEEHLGIAGISENTAGYCGNEIG